MYITYIYIFTLTLSFIYTNTLKNTCHYSTGEPRLTEVVDGSAGGLVVSKALVPQP